MGVCARVCARVLTAEVCFYTLDRGGRGTVKGSITGLDLELGTPHRHAQRCSLMCADFVDGSRSYGCGRVLLLCIYFCKMYASPESTSRGGWVADKWEENMRSHEQGIQPRRLNPVVRSTENCFSPEPRAHFLPRKWVWCWEPQGCCKDIPSMCPVRCLVQLLS